MNNETTIQRARTHIARLPKAFNNEDLHMMTGHARSWIECLHVEGLIDDEVFKALSIELNNAIDDVVRRLENEAKAPRRPWKPKP